MKRAWLGWMLAAVSVLPASALPVSELLLTAHPEARVRPGESLVVQLLVYGIASGENGQNRRVRLAKGGADFSVVTSGGGWLSRPFRYQGAESEDFYTGEGSSWSEILIGQITDVAFQDCVLYTAPERPGRYEVEARLEGKTTRLTLTVDSSAPSQRPSERTSFPAESVSREPCRELAGHWAPFIAQETWFDPKADYLARFDFDGDWQGDNNWDHTDEGSSQAYVHYAAMETRTHWFLVYDLFHPRDYSDRCVAGTCHENDSEGIVLTVRKDGSRYGRLEAMETLAHNNIYSYFADDRVRGNIHDLDGRVELVDGSHPAVYVEPGGHGVYGTGVSQSRYDPGRDDFSGGTGVTYTYKGQAERPRSANDRRVGYELLSIREQWWPRAETGPGDNPTFDDFTAYRPAGGRPACRLAQIPAAFRGRKMASNRARPFWGWYDERTLKKGVLGQGQWAMDPAWGVSQNLRLPEPFSVDYISNSYLGIGADPSSEDTGPAPGSPDLPSEYLTVRRSDDYDENSRTGRFDVRIREDGTVDVFIQHNRLSWRVVQGEAPEDLGSECSQPVPRATFRTFRLEQLDGRGTITLEQRPTVRNDFTVVLRIEDSRGGSDRYHARLTWEWDQRSVVRPLPQAPPPGDDWGRPYEAPPAGVELSSAANDPARYGDREEGQFEFSGRVDELTVFRIRAGRVYAEARKGQPVAVDRFTFTQPLPRTSLREFRLEKEEGRGGVRLLERPSAANGWTAAIEVSDPKKGAGRYVFRLYWRR